MKPFLRRLFGFLLDPLESGREPINPRPLNRKILLAVSALFFGLSLLVFWLLPADGDKGYWFPVIVFGGLGLVGLIIGILGNDRAVAKIWGNR